MNGLEGMRNYSPEELEELLNTEDLSNWTGWEFTRDFIPKTESEIWNQRMRVLWSTPNQNAFIKVPKVNGPSVIYTENNEIRVGDGCCYYLQNKDPNHHEYEKTHDWDKFMKHLQVTEYPDHYLIQKGTY